mmetsp:Transcript_15246/g.21750  ORF Transcript_15246/g.21750 Transcript_15246/m.21750 type:complete len:379 (-) Transcript_15246:13-1149(-)
MTIPMAAMATYVNTRSMLSEYIQKPLLHDVPDSIVPIPIPIDSDSESLSSLEKEKENLYDGLKCSLSSVLNVKSNDFFKPRRRPLVCGHRGNIYGSLENTRASFLECVSMGCDSVELDVFLLKCGTLVVFHGGGDDANPGCLKDYCNTSGNILDLTAAEARLLTFNPHHQEFACGAEYVQREIKQNYIPTLQEVLMDLKGTGIKIKIELKGPNTVEPVLALVNNMDMVDQCHYSSFEHSRIKRVREIHPELNPDGTHVYKTGCLFDELPLNFVDIASEAGASEVHLKYSTCTPEKIQAIHDAGMDSLVWMRGPIGMISDSKNYVDVGNEDASMYRIIMATGVRTLCVNRPDRLIDIVGSAYGNDKVKSIFDLPISTIA